LLARQINVRMNGERIQRLGDGAIHAFGLPLHVERAMMANMAVLRTLRCEIVALETILHHEVRLRPIFVMLKTTLGIADVLAARNMLETGAISRFASVGQFSSYCRCVDRRRISNGRKKGEGNTKNGNRYLAWAFIEAAAGALRVILPGAGHDHGYRGKQSHAAMAREAFRVSREECSAGGGILQPACKPRGGNGRAD
jgi:transposase